MSWGLLLYICIRIAAYWFDVLSTKNLVHVQDPQQKILTLPLFFLCLLFRSILEVH